MASNVLTFPASIGFFEIFFNLKSRVRDAAAVSPTREEDFRSRRQFALELMTKESGAFSSELDVQTMMHQFPNQY